ncbi:MAG TPA: T9SS type A sorting domain-containing protein [Melioribacteraceae bacterium]|nr:T9SS type A sorting domain-containing protein [Melioribacteraceae bacterium]
MKKYRILLICLFISFNLAAQNSIRVMTWNIHDYTPYNPTPTDPGRVDFNNPGLKAVIDEMKPDVLVCQEVRDQASVDQLLKYVLEYKYIAAEFIPSTQMNSVLFYKESIFTSLGNIVHQAETRPINEFPLIYEPTGDTLIIFSVHLKANDINSANNNFDNKQKRASQVQVFRNRTANLPANKNFVILGDFNTLNGSETAFQMLIDQSSKGYVLDPQNSVGEWERNPAYAHTHTMYANNLNVRFDMILISQSLRDPGGVDYGYVPYPIVANDGQHYGKAVNAPPTNLLGQSLADAAVSASDHLPVFADILFGVPSTVDESGIPVQFDLRQNYPNPFNPSTTIHYRIESPGHVTLKVYDFIGREVATLVDQFQLPGIYNSNFSSGDLGLTSGIYFYRIVCGNFSSTKKMILIK